MKIGQTMLRNEDTGSPHSRAVLTFLLILFPRILYMGMDLLLILILC